jgi:hypothetical protein
MKASAWQQLSSDFAMFWNSSIDKQMDLLPEHKEIARSITLLQRNLPTNLHWLLWSIFMGWIAANLYKSH